MKELILEDMLRLCAVGGLDAFAPLFERYGSGHFLTQVEPRRGDIESANLQHLFDWYSNLRDGDAPPLWTPKIPFELTSILSNLHVIEPTEDGRMRYRIYATSVAQVYGSDKTGQDLEDRGYLHVVFHAITIFVGRNRSMLYTQHSPPDNSKVNDCQRLYLPFLNEEGELHRILVGWYPYRRQANDPRLIAEFQAPKKLRLP